MSLLLVISADAFDRVVSAPAPLEGQVEHLREQGENPIGLIGTILHRGMQALDLASAHRGHLLRSKLWQDDVVEHRPVVPHALRPLLGAGILLEVVRREVSHGRRLPLGPTLGDGVLPAGSVGEEASGLPSPYSTYAALTLLSVCGHLATLRVSCPTLRQNPWGWLRRVGLSHTQSEAACGTIQLKLIKLGALVRVTVRRVKFAMASGCPWQNESLPAPPRRMSSPSDHYSAAALQPSGIVQAQAPAGDAQTLKITRAGSQASAKGSPDYLTGTVRVDPMFPANAPSRVSAGHVTFEPGARSAWHTHKADRNLLLMKCDADW